LTKKPANSAMQGVVHWQVMEKTSLAGREMSSQVSADPYLKADQQAQDTLEPRFVIRERLGPGPLFPPGVAQADLSPGLLIGAAHAFGK